MPKRKKAVGLIFLLMIYSCTNLNSDVKHEYYPSGKLKFIKRYKNHVLEGQSQWFYESGNVEQTVLFKNGKEFGSAYYFYPDGALKNFRYWRDGKMVSYVADYYDDTVGMIKSVLLYDDGHLIYRKNFDSLGKFISEEGKR